MKESPVFMRVKQLCDENGIRITSLIEEITGSAGNAPTWKKGNIRADYLTAICEKFCVPTDYLLMGDMFNLHVSGIRTWANNKFFTEKETRRIIEHFQELLLRYRQFVNYVCDLRMPMGEDVDIRLIREASEAKVAELLSWIELLPEYFFGTDDTPTSFSVEAKKIAAERLGDEVMQLFIDAGRLKPGEQLTDEQKESARNLILAALAMDKRSNNG